MAFANVVLISWCDLMVGGRASKSQAYSDAGAIQESASPVHLIALENSPSRS